MDIKGIIKLLTGIAKIFSFIAGFSAFMNWIPDKYKGQAILVFGASSSIAHFAEEIDGWLQPYADKIVAWYLRK